MEIDFLGRQRVFRTGFAQLAIKTGVPAIPFFAPVDESGVVHIQIHEPLDSGNSTQPKSERISSLIEQYAKLLEGYWIADPGNIRKEQFLSHQNHYGRQTEPTVPSPSRSRAA